MTIKFRVEYDPTPIRHIAVQCPYCGKWFSGRDILASGDLRYGCDIVFAEFHCPVCNMNFSGYYPDSGFETVVIKECGDHTEVYKDCLKKKETWE